MLAFATALGRVGGRVVEDVPGLGIGRDRPEALSVGRVLGGFVPVDRRLTPVLLEDVVREPAREVVEIGEIEGRNGRRDAARLRGRVGTRRSPGSLRENRYASVS